MYYPDENENINGGEYSAGENNPTATGEFAASGPAHEPVNGEYHFTAQQADERRGCYDAGYVSSDRASAVPPHYYYSEPQPAKAPREKKPKGERRGPGWAGVIAACLVCALLGGIGGGALGGWFVSRNSGDAAAPGETVLNMAAPASPAVSKNLITSGDAMDPNQIYNMACDHTVGVTTEIVRQTFFGTSSGTVTGSGFIISADGYILTNFHVIEDAVDGGYDVKVYTYDGTEYIASIVGYEKDNDVAVLKIDADGLPAATIGDSDGIQVGQSAYAVGNPLGELAYTMTTGSVSALDREISFTDSDTGVSNTINMFQIDAAVNSGNSGGPVYNNRGEVIGIVTAKYGANTTGVEGLGFAIPINDAVSIANDIITMGYVRGKALLGITGQSVTAMAVQYYNMVPGAYVTQVNAGSCAETAGVKAGDIIVALGEAEINSWSDLASAKKEYRAGETATLKVYRGGEYLELSVTFDEETPDSVSGTQTAPETGETPETPVDVWPFSGMGRP